MKKFILCLLLVCFGFAGCAGFQLPFDEHTLHQDPEQTIATLELIAKNLFIVYDPSITDAEFEEFVGEYEDWYRRYEAVVLLYNLYFPEHDSEAMDALAATVEASRANFDAIVAERQP